MGRFNKSDQPCWSCQKACGGCSWSADFTPIEGWTAIPKIYHGSRIDDITYKIIQCPEYIADDEETMNRGKQKPGKAD